MNHTHELILRSCLASAEQRFNRGLNTRFAPSSDSRAICETDGRSDEETQFEDWDPLPSSDSSLSTRRPQRVKKGSSSVTFGVASLKGTTTFAGQDGLSSPALTSSTASPSSSPRYSKSRCTGAPGSECSTRASPAHDINALPEALKPAVHKSVSAPPELSRASRLKRSLSAHSGRTPSGKRLQGDQDPENREIMRLRQDENLDFDEIAKIMNKNRVKAHKPATFTPNAIYSRYRRNAPLIAAACGKKFMPARRDQRENGLGISFKQPFILGLFDDDEDQLLVRAVKDIEDRKWQLVAARLRELGGGTHPPEVCCSRFLSL